MTDWFGAFCDEMLQWLRRLRSNVLCLNGKFRISTSVSFGCLVGRFSSSRSLSKFLEHTEFQG